MPNKKDYAHDGCVPPSDGHDHLLAGISGIARRVGPVFMIPVGNDTGFCEAKMKYYPTNFDI